MISRQSWVLPDHWWLLPLAVGVVAAFLGRRTKPIALARVERAFNSVWRPVATGVLPAVLGAWVWGSLDPPPVYHDEVAYRLQAEIFASGRLTGDPAPLPEFFEQYHVLVSPRLAPKYLPGHALALVPGIWLGRSGLGPLALAGISGGLLFVLARCLAGPWVAALAWTLWATAPAPLSWRCTYFSEATSGAAWLAACWALLDWLDTSRRASLVAGATFLGSCAIPLPLSAGCLSLPAARGSDTSKGDRRALWAFLC